MSSQTNTARSDRAFAGAVAFAAILCVLTAVIAGTSEQPGNRSLIAVALAFVIAVPIGVGLWAWRENESGRFGRLLFAAGCIFFLATLAESSNEWIYSTGRVGIWLAEACVPLILLTFPSGDLRTKVDRRIVAAFVTVVALLYVPTAFLVASYQVPVPYASCTDDCPANAFMLLEQEPGFVASVVYPLRDAATVALFLLVATVLTRRLTQTTPLMRRALTPVLLTAAFRLVLLAAFVLTRRADPDASALAAIGWLYVLCLPAIALAFFIGLLRRKLFEATALQHLALRLRDHPDADELRGVLADVIADPTLQLAYPGTRRDADWVDAAGRSIELPPPGGDRTVTVVQDGDHPVAALVYDSALEEQDEFVAAAGSFAFAALENQRLAAKVDASLAELQESRARIQAAADGERLRIERDLHDGAQQRLVALRIRLELAGDVVEREPGRGAGLFGELGDELEAALEEVRSLAHGIYPSLLADQGLCEALRAVARRASLATTVNSDKVGRYPVEIETAVYFCCLEALQNAAKHALGATSVSISLRENGDLTFAVEDDGAGFAAGTRAGTGLTNMHDRLAAVGGELTIGPGAGGTGTQVAGSIPLWGTAPGTRL
jgi:signal transduction histidine kinase